MIAQQQLASMACCIFCLKNPSVFPKFVYICVRQLSIIATEG
jgi:hypothetical protein